MTPTLTVIAVLEYEGKQYTVTQKHEQYDFYEDADDQKSNLYYMWEDGNYSCDCNRFAFISYAYDDWPGQRHEEDGRFPCGHSITLVSLTLIGEAPE